MHHKAIETPYKRVEQIGDSTLYLGDCLDILPTLDKADAVITSPPYGDIRDYGGHHKTTCQLEVIEHISKMLVDGGACMWNTADQTVNGSESGESFRQALHAIECGMRLHDTMIYCKPGVTFPDKNRYHPAFEYMFIFSNGAPNVFNPLMDRRNKWAGTMVHGTDRQKDGSTKKTNGAGKRDIPIMGSRFNWWVVDANGSNDGNTSPHPAKMPYAIASDHTYTWTNEGDLVVDPFMGSGTTGVACMNLGRKFIGIEIEEKYFDIACERIDQAQRQQRLFD